MYARTILLDMDDVLCNLVDTWIQILNSRYDVQINKEDITTWHIGASIRIKYPELTDSQVYEPLNHASIWELSPIMPGAKKGLEEIKANGWISVIVTSLPSMQCDFEQVVKGKYNWIRKYISGLVDEKNIVITRNKNLVRGDVLIDDGPHNLIGSINKTIVFDQPWNRCLDLPNRVNHWDEVKDVCHELFRENK